MNTVPLIRAELAFATPRKLPKPAQLKGRVVVLDVAFASEASGGGFEKITHPFIVGLGSRLVGWVDHHDHTMHSRYADDSRFVLSTKAEHGACPEMITPDIVKRIGQVDTIVCHTDFDGLCSAAKWLRSGIEPYEGADDDARAIDTRLKTPGPLAQRIDRALRARPRDTALFGIVVRHLSTGLRDSSLWESIDSAASELVQIEEDTRKLARGFNIFRSSSQGDVAFVDVTGSKSRYDKTQLLLLGQERATIAVVRDRDTLTLAAGFDSGINFLSLLGLSGGMPTLVSVPASGMDAVLTKIGITSDDIMRLSIT